MSETAIAIGILALGVGLIILRWVVLGLAIWALWFGIADIVAVGVNFWAVAWTVLGGIGIVGFIADMFRK